MAANTLVVSLFGSLFAGVGFLWLLRRNAALCVKISCAAQVVVPAVMAVSLLVSGAVVPALVSAVFSALAAWCFYLWRAELALCSRLLSVAGEALTANPHLVSASVGLNVVHVAVVLPVIALMVAATRVGDAVPYALAATTVAGVDGALLSCVDDAGAAVPCCMWETAPASVAYIVFASLCVSWTTFLVFEMRLFAIAHVVTRWYRLPLGARLPGSPLREALACAAGPSFGSLCLGSFVLTLADAARRAQEASRRRGDGIAAMIVACIVACIAEVVSALTRFATIRLAATGQGFMDAARDQIALLKRNFLATYAVWQFPPTILAFTSAVAAAAAALIAVAVFAAAGSRVVSSSGPAGSNARLDAADALSSLTPLVGGGAFALVLVVLSYLSSLVIHVTGAFALDLCGFAARTDSLSACLTLKTASMSAGRRTSTQPSARARRFTPSSPPCRRCASARLCSSRTASWATRPSRAARPTRSRSRRPPPAPRYDNPVLTNDDL